jgi:hypothetical protein
VSDSGGGVARYVDFAAAPQRNCVGHGGHHAPGASQQYVRTVNPERTLEESWLKSRRFGRANACRSARSGFLRVSRGQWWDRATARSSGS